MAVNMMTRWRQLLRANQKQPEKALFEALAVEEIRMAADVLPACL